MSKYILSFLFFVSYVNLCVDAKNHSRASHKLKENKQLGDKIVGGYETTIENHPYQAYLLLEDHNNEYYQCGGSLISDEWVLSAAHCMHDIKIVRVRLGCTNHQDGCQSFESKNFKVHPQYNAKTFDNDVSVVKLPNKAKPNGKTVKVIKLNDVGNTTPAKTLMTVSGWGTTQEGGSVTEILRAVQVTVQPKSYCKEKAHTTRQMFCASDEGKDSCQGDSGGPAVTGDTADNPTQIGIVSFGVGCAQENHPGVYSDLSSTGIRSFVFEETGI